MCRLCGRVIRCVFDSMPSKLPRPSGTRSITTTAARPRPSRQSHISSSSLINSALNIERTASTTPPTFLLPFRANLHRAAVIQQAAPTTPTPQDTTSAPLPPSMLRSTLPATSTINDTPTPFSPSSTTDSTKPLVLSKSLQTLLPYLSSQTPHYITTHIHRFPYLLQQGDTLRLPFHMHGVSSGDILRLNRASLLGSRDFTLKAGTNSTETYDAKRTGEPNYLDERLFEVRARVMGVDSGPMTTKEKTKRRNRRTKTVKSKHRYTVLKIMEVRVRTLEELLAGKDMVVLE